REEFTGGAFFFQAEDGIRDFHVTGVQTCALPLSSDGGATWNVPVVAAKISDRPAAGGLRDDPLPSVAMDSVGNIYVVWQDCRFRTNCSSNDLVMSTSSDGANWSAPARIPIDTMTSGADHFIPGLGIDPTTGGSTAHLGLSYYYYPQANCSAST